MWCEDDAGKMTDVEVQTVILANHTDTLLRAALDGRRHHIAVIEFGLTLPQAR